MTADRKWMEQLGFELKHDERQGWIVIEDGADDRCATITERVLWEALIEALAASVAPAEPIGEVKRSHFGGRTRNIGFDSVVMYEGAKVSPGDKVYAAPAAPAEPTRAGRWVPIEEGLPAKYRDVIVRCRKDGETWHCVGRVNRHRQWDKATYSHDIKGQYGISDVVEWFEPDWAATPVAPAEPTHLRRADGTLSGVFIESVSSEAAAVADDLRNWFDFLPGHAQPTIERAVRLLETRP